MTALIGKISLAIIGSYMLTYILDFIARKIYEWKKRNK